VSVGSVIFGVSVFFAFFEEPTTRGGRGVSLFFFLSLLFLLAVLIGAREELALLALIGTVAPEGGGHGILSAASTLASRSVALVAATLASRSSLPGSTKEMRGACGRVDVVGAKELK